MNRDWQNDMERFAEQYNEAAAQLHKMCEMYEAEKGRADNYQNRYNSLIRLVQEVSEYLSWRNPGGLQGSELALKLIYKWLEENPRLEVQA